MNKSSSLNSITNAICILKKKQVIAYPTETVFGIGCDPDSKIAVLRLLKLKRRPIEKGLILISAYYEQLKPYVDDSILTQEQKNKIFAIWPGFVTFTFPASPTTPFWLKGKFNSLAIRVTSHPLAIKLCKEFGKPLVSTSANLSGLLPCRTVNEIREQFGKSFPIVVGKINNNSPSEIRDAKTGKRLR